MTQEEFQNAVLSKFDKIETRLGNIETKVGSIETKVGSIETKVGSIETKVGSIETKVDNIETELKEVKEFQKTSLYDVVQYVNERTERTEDKLDVLNARLFNQEAEIRGLRRVK